MEKNDLFEKFEHEYSVSKTLSFRLVPDERTQAWIDERGLVAEDERLADDAFRAKRLMDAVHRGFVDRVMAEAADGLAPRFEEVAARAADLAEASDAEARSKARAALADAKAAARGEIAAAFRADEAFGGLFGADMRAKTAPAAFADDSEAVAMFAGFARLDAVFAKYDKNRALLYAAGGEAGSVAARLVDDDLPRHLANVAAWNAILEDFPDVARAVEDELADAIGGLPDMTPAGFAACATQAGIERMNSFIGGVALEDGSKLRGVNEFANLRMQADGASVPRMIPLYRQVLSDRASALSFLPVAMSSDEECFDALEGLEGSLSSSRAFPRIAGLLDGVDLRPCGVNVASNRLSELSALLFGGAGWAAVDEALDLAAEGVWGGDYAPTAALGSKSRRAKWRKKPVFGWDEIARALELSGKPASASVLAGRVRSAWEAAEAAWPAVLREKARLGQRGRSLAESPEAVAAVKAWLDALLDALRAVRVFECPADECRDAQFYAVYDAAADVAGDVSPVYGRVRDWATRRPYSTRRFQLRFGLPTVGAGWDVNKEGDNGMVLLRRGGAFYVGIAHRPAKRALKSIPFAAEGEEAFEKLFYRQSRPAVMALPKSYIRSKAAVARLEAERPDVLRVYGAGTFKKSLANGKPNPAFSVDDVRLLADWFKECIARDPNMDVFGFRFSPTSSYETIHDFYREFDAQAYSTRFERMSAAAVEDMVERGDLYLFRMWTRHMGEKVHGAGSMYLHWWNLLFSEENARRGVLKLLGGAELFFRPASIAEPVVHRKGSVLVNRTVVDPDTGAVERIPEDVYQEIYRWRNGMASEGSLSDAARALWASGKVVAKEAAYDIVKDRRFAEDRYMMTVPISINRLDGPAPYKAVFNDRVLSAVAGDPDLRILGINRGERNLVYATVIDRAGRIVEQRGFNVMDGIDWRARLDAVEKRRTGQRRGWKAVEGIATVKDAYIGRVVREVVDMMARHRAVVAVEDLSSGFKDRRARFEKNVYARFERRLVDKLSYFASKPAYVGPWESGGACRGYQLALPSAAVGDDKGRQNGFVFYANPWKVSAIDPATGFACLFDTRARKESDARAFFGPFRSIRYVPERGWFEFSWDYADFDSVEVRGGRTAWTACTHNPSRTVAVPVDEGGRRRWKARDVDVTHEIARALADAGVEYADGRDLRADIAASGSKDLARRILSAFRVLMRMRYSAPYEADPEKDYVLSPVAAADGTFFDSRTAPATMPQAGDANDAYHVALKALQMLEEDLGETKSGYACVACPENPAGRWLAFAQKVAESL